MNTELTLLTFATSSLRKISGINLPKLKIRVAQPQDVEITEVLTGVLKQSRALQSHQQGFDRNVWKLWNFIDERTINHNTFCHKAETSKIVRWFSNKVFSKH